MTLVHLREYNIRNIFVEKSYAKCGRETIPRPFSEKIKIEFMSGSIVLKFYTVCFYWMVIYGLSKYSESKLQTTCFYLI